MGDSSVSCAFSGLTMICEPVVFLPLAESEFVDIRGARMTVLGSQSNALFSPLTLPIRGWVDSCGCLEDIIKDANTEAIEKTYGMTIETFTEACCYGNKIMLGGQEFVGRGCFIHPEIYDNFSKSLKEESSCWDAKDIGEGDLEAIGCKLVQDLNEYEDGSEHESAEDILARICAKRFERFNLIYEHPAIPGVQFKCDGNYVHVDGLNPFFGGLKNLHKQLTKQGFPGFPEADIERAKAASHMRGVFQKDIAALLKRDGSDRHYAELTAGTEDERDKPEFGVRLCTYDYIRWMESFGEALFDEYLKHWAKGELLDRVEQLFYLQWSFSYANRVLMPTVVGTQYPEHYLTAKIAGFINQVAQKRLIS